ncbi:polysaccharide deacetylase family protein [Fulvivirga sedimenti]|uniref:Polysaccharide deacetylase family protein n=1 Tax=Fulvivirga sedimenti TaxID=2879465 RepID=A0A9X1KXY4_9BACT|nr:polysaccharide deacetylase family protein [Fulvivirga sedimenti]MCA6075113.1 polysaccharide deacetylase family protein [Fulvivirga sedimenti]MCA6076290.1 polysaccharide deacetylase family protein [Fulvivirga sedimenti]MCA6077418.1 polysaccharide deacetylase family protein [Fulvivirga sedimenti]
MKNALTVLFLSCLVLACSPEKEGHSGETVITKWPDDKKAALSITFDDGIINQLTVARPIMDQYNLKGTFFIITGKVEGSQPGKFIGRSPEEIIKETADIETNENNFFERASLIAFTGTSEAEDYHARVGSLYEQGKVEEAYQLLDEGYSKIRNGSMKDTNDVVFHNNVEDTTTWEQYRSYAADGHEIASHTVTHPRLAVLDEINMKYELEQSKADIEKFLGPEYTFSAEGPYGTENERVMSYAYDIYPALRNRMPEPYLEELNRSSDKSPLDSDEEYVQWQRGALTRHSVDDMKGWVNTALSGSGVWLVLVFHGVDQFGWEPKTGEELDQYFSFVNDQRDSLWVDTFGNVTKYIRERKNTVIETKSEDNRISIRLSTELDPESYNVPVTLKTYIPESWTKISITDPTGKNIQAIFKDDANGKYVLFNVIPSAGELVLQKN